jgi:uncharacterized protein YkwD
MKRIAYSLLIAALLSTLTLAACSGGTTTEATTSENPTLIPPIVLNEPSNNSALVGAANNTTVPPLCSGAQNTNTTAYATEVIRLVNVERSNNGLAALMAQTNIRDAAQKHTIDMACNFFVSHTGSDGSVFEDRLDLFGYYWMYAGENIAAGYATPSAVVTAWMNSSLHRANILDPEFTEIGVGYVYNPNDTTHQYHYWTMDLGVR